MHLSPSSSSHPHPSPNLIQAPPTFTNVLSVFCRLSGKTSPAIVLYPHLRISTITHAASILYRLNSNPSSYSRSCSYSTLSPPTHLPPSSHSHLAPFFPPTTLFLIPPSLPTLLTHPHRQPPSCPSSPSAHHRYKVSRAPLRPHPRAGHPKLFPQLPLTLGHSRPTQLITR